ncbi:ABC transporter ATP-binding protein [Catenovulum sp. SM1970]|uniref:ABC transporter ATP-binding protein n=1 Tax=Marinifaba aquimaris TaxID=2741323 RepID=UPI001574EBAF|nr:ABC transporter ATP-binding protein [Marinifaba aquimaris]NTS77774.1 ABC transporter ATP-binding protein [Marinifaba aquimaris]
MSNTVSTDSLTSIQLSAEQLGFSIADKKIIEQVSLTLTQGEMLGVIGPNGAGKTSLLKLLYGAYQAQTGAVTLQSQNLASYSAMQIAQQVAVVSQHETNSFDLSVLDIARMGLVPHKSLFALDSADDKQVIQQALDKVDLIDKQTRIFSTLSGGEQQRALIARALVQQADILILDEPTNHLDVYYQHQILSLIKKLNLSVIVTIHDLNLAAQYCDKLCLLNRGQIVSHGTPEQVLTVEQLTDVFRLPCMIDTQPFSNKIRINFAPANNQLLEQLKVLAND